MEILCTIIVTIKQNIILLNVLFRISLRSFYIGKQANVRVGT